MSTSPPLRSTRARRPRRNAKEAKRKALEAIYDQVVSAELTEWNQDPELLNWLTNLR